MQQTLEGGVHDYAFPIPILLCAVKKTQRSTVSHSTPLCGWDKKGRILPQHVYYWGQ